MTDEGAVIFGNEARQFIEGKMFVWGHETIARNLQNEIAKASTTDERALYLRRLLIASNAYRRLFEKAIEDGKFSANKIREEEERRKWWRPAA